MSDASAVPLVLSARLSMLRAVSAVRLWLPASVHAAGERRHVLEAMRHALASTRLGEGAEAEAAHCLQPVRFTFTFILMREREHCVQPVRHLRSIATKGHIDRMCQVGQASPASIATSCDTEARAMHSCGTSVSTTRRSMRCCDRHFLDTS